MHNTNDSLKSTVKRGELKFLANVKECKRKKIRNTQSIPGSSPQHLMHSRHHKSLCHICWSSYKFSFIEFKLMSFPPKMRFYIMTWKDKGTAHLHSPYCLNLQGQESCFLPAFILYMLYSYPPHGCKATQLFIWNLTIAHIIIPQNFTFGDLVFMSFENALLTPAKKKKPYKASMHESEKGLDLECLVLLAKKASGINSRGLI